MDRHGTALFPWVRTSGQNGYGKAFHYLLLPRLAR